MDASTFLSYLTSHYDVGLVEYAQVEGVDQVLRVGEGVRARVVLQGRELLPDAVGVVLCSRMEHETFPEGRVYTAVERGGFEGTWLLPGADYEPIPWEGLLAAAARRAGQRPHDPLDLAAVRRYVTGATHVDTQYQLPDARTWAVADATHTWLHEVADDLAARDAQRGARAPGPVDPHELVRRLKAGLEASSARYGFLIHENLTRLTQAMRGPRRLLGEAPPSNDEKAVWAAVKHLSAVMAGVPVAAYAPGALAQVLGLPSAVDADWWGSGPLLGMALVTTPTLGTSLQSLREADPARGVLAQQYLSWVGDGDPFLS